MSFLNHPATFMGGSMAIGMGSGALYSYMDNKPYANSMVAGAALGAAAGAGGLGFAASSFGKTVKPINALRTAGELAGITAIGAQAGAIYAASTGNNYGPSMAAGVTFAGLTGTALYGKVGMFTRAVV